MNRSSHLPSLPPLLPARLNTLWDEGIFARLNVLGNEGTFVSLLRLLPTILTSSLFLVFGLLNVLLACLKWTLFIMIIGITFMLGLVLLLMAVALMGAVVVLAMNEAAEVAAREKAALTPLRTKKEKKDRLAKLKGVVTSKVPGEGKEAANTTGPEGGEEPAAADDGAEEPFERMMQGLRGKGNPGQKKADDKAALPRQKEELQKTRL